MAAKRIRTIVTVREDDPVPRRSSRQSQNRAIIVIVLVLLGLFLAAGPMKDFSAQALL